MKYAFSVFVLDCGKRQLMARGQPVALTRQQYDLLLFFVTQPERLVSNDELLRQIWPGKVVTSNTVDQSISKLRKVLHLQKPEAYFERVYGHGTRFLPQVQVRGSGFGAKGVLAFLMMLAVSLLLAFWVVVPSQDTAAGNFARPILLPIASGEPNAQKAGAISGALLIGRLLDYGDKVAVRNYQDRPSYLDYSQYLRNQRRVSPRLYTLSADLGFSDLGYEIRLTLTDAAQAESELVFRDSVQSKVFMAATQWLYRQMELRFAGPGFQSILPRNNYALEMYLSGLSSLDRGDADGAARFLQISIGQDANFDLPRLELAGIFIAQGKYPPALAQLDTLTMDRMPVVARIRAGFLRGEALQGMGKYRRAQIAYSRVLESNAGGTHPLLGRVRLALAKTLLRLSQAQLAMNELSWLETNLDAATTPVILAAALLTKARALLDSNQVDAARVAALKSLGLYSKLGELLQGSEIHAVLARAATYRANYLEANVHLARSLSIAKSLGSDADSVKALTQMIPIVLMQGSVDRAIALNDELSKLAKQLANTSAQLQVYQFRIDLAKYRQQWSEAERHLQDYRALAIRSEDSRALLESDFQFIDLLLDQGSLDDVVGLARATQVRIAELPGLGFQARQNRMEARILYLSGERQASLTLLRSMLARTTDAIGKKSRLKSSMLLAAYLTQDSDSTGALEILDAIGAANPPAYPYLILKARAFLQLDRPIKALELTSQAKILANQLWTGADQRFLESVVERNKTR